MAGKKQGTTGAPEASIGAVKPGKDSNQPAKAKAGRNLRKPKPGAPEPALTSRALAETGPAGRRRGVVALVAQTSSMCAAPARYRCH